MHRTKTYVFRVGGRADVGALCNSSVCLRAHIETNEKIRVLSFNIKEQDILLKDNVSRNQSYLEPIYFCIVLKREKRQI